METIQKQFPILYRVLEYNKTCSKIQWQEINKIRAGHRHRKKIQREDLTVSAE